ncbi:uncharacterized protein EI90DRAFT_3129467 [Cantharellus anzutake]|uniref:uncharacterized protein n=1 Tax=Cantharellus anzutake TaxID=1750568 RepID=UPI0019058BF5|nr:uncharacterized protein EI90DRAFT_3129467 [Cantharellus anzutake]KAF8324915.1 hypothetical protein EI90DRAFT_3129467 [Cantharellus anzutake]
MSSSLPSTSEKTRSQDSNEWDARILDEKVNNHGKKFYLVEWVDEPKPGKPPKTWANEWISARRASRELIESWETQKRENEMLRETDRQRELRLARENGKLRESKRTATEAFGLNHRKSGTSRLSASATRKRRKLFLSSSPETSEHGTAPPTSQYPMKEKDAKSKPSSRLNDDDTYTPSLSVDDDSDSDADFVASLLSPSRRSETKSQLVRGNSNVPTRLSNGRSSVSEESGTNETYPITRALSQRQNASSSVRKVGRTSHAQSPAKSKEVSPTQYRAEVILPVRPPLSPVSSKAPSYSQRSDPIESANFSSQPNPSKTLHRNEPTDNISSFTPTNPTCSVSNPVLGSESTVSRSSMDNGQPRKSFAIMSLQTPSIANPRESESVRRESPVEDYPPSQETGASSDRQTDTRKDFKADNHAAAQLLLPSVAGNFNDAFMVNSGINDEPAGLDSRTVLTQSVVPATVSDNAGDTTITSQSSSNPSMSQQLKSTLDLLDSRNHMINDLRKQKADVEARLIAALRSSEPHISSNDDWDAIIAALRAQNVALESQLNKVAPSFEQQIGELRIQVEELAERDARHDHSAQELTHQLAMMRTELEQARSTNRELSQVNRKLAGTIARLEKNVAHASNDMASTRSRMESQQELIADLKTQVDNLANRLRAHAKSSGNDITNRESEAQRDEIQKLRHELSNQGPNIRQDGNANREAELKRALAASEERIASLIAQTSSDAEESSRLRASLDEERELHQSSKDSIEYLRQRYQHASDAAAKLGQENRILERKNDQAASQANDGVKQAQLFYRTQIQRLEQELDQSNTRVAILNKKGIRTVTGNIDTLEVDYRSLTFRHEQLRQEHSELENDLHDLQLVAVEFKEHVDRLAAVGVDVDYPIEYVIDDVIERFNFLLEPWNHFNRLSDVGIDVELEPKSFEALVDRIIARIRAPIGVELESNLNEPNPAISTQTQQSGTLPTDRPLSPPDFSNINDDVTDAQYRETSPASLALPPADTSLLSKSEPVPLPSSQNQPTALLSNTPPYTQQDPQDEVFPCPVLEKPHEPCLSTFLARDELKRHILDSHVELTLYTFNTAQSKPNPNS